MRTSESITKLAAALVAAQAEVENATKNADNPFYKSSYADLGEVLRVSKPVFAKHGISIVQMPGMEPGQATLENIILHESGEWIAHTAGAPLAPKETKDGPKPADAQSLGSAITYLRRYSLAAIAGITQEDDDGNAASNPGKSSSRPAQAKTGPQDDMIPCPACGGEMWDNRTDKKNPRAPDLKCKDREGCDHAIWLKSWRDDLHKHLADLHTSGVIDASERDRAEKASASLEPDKMATVAEWVDKKIKDGVVGAEA